GPRGGILPRGGPARHLRGSRETRPRRGRPARRSAAGHRARIFRRTQPDADRPEAGRAARHRQDAHQTGDEQVEAGPAGPVGRGPLNPQDLENLAPLYALGALDGEDLVRFSEELERSESLRALVREYREASTAIPHALDP